MEKKWSVTELVNGIKRLIDSRLQKITLVGEIINYSRSSSGHLYFQLTDGRSSIACVCFQSSLGKLRGVIPHLKDGTTILIKGKCTVYPARGSLQVIADTIELLDREGVLRKEFERLKKELHLAGLFDIEHKKKIPVLPRRIAILTSPQGAAVMDFLKIFRERSPIVDLLVVPVPVQGEHAPSKIIQALDHLKQRNDLDVILITRGGGSIEDLWCFNDRLLITKVFEMQTPIISAIGHERDFTLLDYIADHRCPTPSAAAQELSENQFRMGQRLEAAQTKIVQASQLVLREVDRRLALLRPDRSLGKLEQSHLSYKHRLQVARPSKERFDTDIMNAIHLQMDGAFQEIGQLIDQKIDLFKSKVDRLELIVKHCNPGQVLSRGYTMLEDQDGNVVMDRKVFRSEEGPYKLSFRDGHEWVKGV
jgi:exodeoxyribonuclease VII large subunit